MSKKIALSFLLAFTPTLFAEECVPAHEYYPFEGKWASKNDRGDVELGMYSRVSPDGKYVLRSFSGKGLTQVTLMELVKGKSESERNKVIPYETPLKNEAFPVQGSWRYIVDIGGEHYLLSDLLKDQKKAKKQFKGGITGFYTVAAELVGGQLKEHKIRSLSWPSGNTENQGVGVLSNRIITAQIVSPKKAKLTDKGDVNYMCKNLQSTDGQVMSLPMLSPDGKEFASMPQNPRSSQVSMRIYQIGNDHKTCEKKDNLNVVAAKVLFSRPEQNMVLFYASGAMGNQGNGVYFYDRLSKSQFGLQDDSRRVRADSYPGFTYDGRIVYGAYWEECTVSGCVEKSGYVVSDPYQSKMVQDFVKENPDKSNHLSKCITKEKVTDVAKVYNEMWKYGQP
jgi:hypothetical protein